MDAPLIKTLSDVGFPAVLCLYLLWRADRTLIPAIKSHLTANEVMAKAVAEMALGVKDTSAHLLGLSTRIDEIANQVTNESSDLAELITAAKLAAEQAAAEALRAALAVDRLTTLVEQGAIVRRIPQADQARKEHPHG